MQRAAAYSFVAHVVFLILAIIFSRHIPRTKPTIYTVKIVEQAPQKTTHPAQEVAPKTVTKPEKPQNRQKVAPKPPKPENRQKVAPKPEPKPQPKPALESTVDIKQRIEDLRKKKEQEELAREQEEQERKRQNKIAHIRQEIEARNAAAQEATNQAEYGRLASEYEIALHEIFYSSWTFPDIMGVYSMSARVLITVYPDGRVDVNKILKPSGNRVFDRSTLKAITDAGRVPPPPFGKIVEIEVEFRPERR